MQPHNTSNLIFSHGISETELLHHPVLEALPVAIYTCDAKGCIKMYNKSAIDLWGAEPENDIDIWSSSWMMYASDGEPLPIGECPIANVLKGKPVLADREVLIRRADGSNRMVIPQARAIMNDTGKIIGAVNMLMDVSLRRTAEIDIARLAAIVQSSDDAIISKTLQGVVTSWNPGAERLFGYTAEEMIGKPILKLIPAERAEEEPQILSRIQRGERVEHFDTQRLTKSGKLVDISLTISPVRNSSGIIIGASKIARDITIHKQLYSALHQSEQKFRKLINQAPVGITILRGQNFLIEMANTSYLEIVGKSEEHFVGKGLMEALPELKDQGIAELLLSVLRTGNPYHGNEFGVDIHRHGQIKKLFFNFTYQPLRENDGTADRIIVIASDVTKSVEDKHSVSESEKQFRKMVMQSPIPMAIFRGQDHVIEMANYAMYHKIWRKEEKDVIGRKALEVFPELTDQKFPEILQRVLTTGISHKEDEALAYVAGDDGMKKFYLDFEYAPLMDTDGTVSGIMITVNDVTEKVESRHRVEEAEQSTRLAVSAAEMGTFDWNLSTNRFTSSQRLHDIFGYKDLEGITHQDLIGRFHPDDKAIRDKAVQESSAKGSLHYVARIVWPDQSIRWIKVYGKVVFDDQLKPQRMYGTVMDITEEKTTLKALQENERRLKIAVEAAEMGTWELNLLTKELQHSDRYLQILGFEPGSRPTHPDILKKIHPDDLALRNEAIREAINGGTLDFEMRICPSADITRWIRSKGNVFYDKDGNPERILGTTLDITDQRAAFDILLQSEERFKAIANTAPVMIWMTGNEKYAGFHNTSWLNFTGKKSEHAAVYDWIDAVHPDDVDEYANAYKEAYQKQQAFHREYRLKRYDGQYRWISDNAVPRYDSAGNFIGFISASMDVDDEKRFNEKLQASELLFKTIANVSPVALWMTDRTGSNTFVNQTWIEWTGKPLEEQFGEGWLSAIVEEDRKYVTDICRNSFERKEGFVVEFRLLRRDGETRWMLSEGGPYYNIDREFCGLAGSVADITDRKQQEIQKNDFLAVASHELKTPITSIKAYTQLLAKTFEANDNAFVKNALTKMENQVNKMTKLVSDFLKLSKIESGKFELTPEVFDLTELVVETSVDIQMVSANHRLIVKRSGPLFVNADRERIAQVITNFLNNAVKYSPDSKDIIVGTELEDGWVSVNVEDRGIGIKEEEHQKIFERFYRANANANTAFSGFGIGLYLCSEIIRRHGGNIGVKSKAGEGSVFYFRLPQAK